MVILMNKDKTLIITVPSVIYEKETNVDKINFLFPQMYGELNLADCAMVVQYISPDKKLHRELLVKDNELYKDHLQFHFPINTKVTSASGNVVLSVTIYNVAEEGLNGNPDIYEQVLRTSEITFPVKPIKELITWEADAALSAVDKRMLELEAKLKAADREIAALDSEKADNFYIEGDNMYLSSDGEVINPDNPVNIGSHTWEDYSDDESPIGDDGCYHNHADNFAIIGNKLYLASDGKVINPDNPVDIGSHTWGDFDEESSSD